MAEEKTPIDYKLHSAIPSEGLYSIADSVGNRKWVSKGKSIDGWTVGDFDSKKNEVTLIQGKVMRRVGLAGSTILPYTVPTATPISDVVGGGNYSEMEEELGHQAWAGGLPNVMAIDLVALQKMKDEEMMRKQMRGFKRSGLSPPSYQIETATPMKTYKKLDENGNIEIHKYRGDLPSDALPEYKQ